MLLLQSRSYNNERSCIFGHSYRFCFFFQSFHFCKLLRTGKFETEFLFPAPDQIYARYDSRVRSYDERKGDTQSSLRCRFLTALLSTLNPYFSSLTQSLHLWDKHSEPRVSIPHFMQIAQNKILMLRMESCQSHTYCRKGSKQIKTKRAPKSSYPLPAFFLHLYKFLTFHFL